MSKKVIAIPTCNVAYAISLVGGKWKIIIIWKLIAGPARFNEIRRHVEGISESVLSLQLKELEKDAIIRRIDYKAMPLHVEYELTDYGRELKDIVEQLEQWALRYRQAVHPKNLRDPQTED